MRFLFPLLALLFWTGCVNTRSIRSLHEIHAENNRDLVLELSPELALELLKQPVQKPLLIEFSADWCAPCRQLARPLQTLASKAAGRYQIVTVDVTESTEVMEKFGVQPRLPAFMLKLPGVPTPLIRYGAGPVFEQLAGFLKRRDNPTAVPLVSRPLDKAQAYKAILVAGSSENANFLQELYWNYSWLLQKGYKADEIGCFYAEPDLLSYLDDRAQFDELKSMAAICHPLQHKKLLESIRVSLHSKPENFYLYVSSHGAEPVEDKFAEYYKAKCMARAPSLVVDQVPADCASSQGLTVNDLAAVMKNSDQTKKYLVLQGCYTGGFISPKDDPRTAPSELAKIPNIRIMTASSANKASFGCHPGAQATFFGTAYGMSVIEHRESFDRMDWTKIFQDVRKEVAKIEGKIPLARRQPSDPQFFAN